MSIKSEGFSEEALKQPEIKEAITKEEIEQFFSFADPILKVEWGKEGPPEEYMPEYIAANPDSTKIFIAQNEDGEIVGGGKVKKLTKDNLERLGLQKILSDKKDSILLEYSEVKEDYRNQGLFSKLIQKRVDWANEQGAEYMCAEVEITRPISAHIKIRDGFTFIGIKEPGEGIAEPYFVAIKKISEKELITEEDKNNQTKFERKEVEVSEHSYGELNELFSVGWVGVGMKFSSQDAPWTLILEKKPINV